MNTELQDDKEVESIDDIDTDIIEDEDKTEIEKKLLKKINITASKYSGPIPHPNILRGYEEIQPGAADRILKMAEKEQEHRFAMSRKCLETDSRDSLLGIIVALIISLATIIAGVWIAVNVKNLGGIVLGGFFGVSGIGAIVITVIKSTQATWKNNNTNEE